MDILKKIESLPERLMREDDDKVCLEPMVNPMKAFAQTLLDRGLSKTTMSRYSEYFFMFGDNLLRERNFQDDKEKKRTVSLEVILTEAERANIPKFYTFPNKNGFPDYEWKKVTAYKNFCEKFYKFLTEQYTV